MKKFLISLLAVTLSIVLLQTLSGAKTKQLIPCAEILNPKACVSKNAGGVALIYTIKRKFRGQRTSLSVHALHLPQPSSFGNYDGYEVLASIPNDISWIFRLHPVTEHGETIWVGKDDEISFGYRPAHIKVRPIHTATKKFGVVILENTLMKCSKK